MSNRLPSYEHVDILGDNDILAAYVAVEDWREHLPGSSGSRIHGHQSAICIDKGVWRDGDVLHLCGSVATGRIHARFYPYLP